MCDPVKLKAIALIDDAGSVEDLAASFREVMPRRWVEPDWEGDFEAINGINIIPGHYEPDQTGQGTPNVLVEMSSFEDIPRAIEFNCGSVPCVGTIAGYRAASNFDGGKDMAWYELTVV